MMTAGRSLVIVCNSRSHPGRTRSIETYVELLNSAGERLCLLPTYRANLKERWFAESGAMEAGAKLADDEVPRMHEELWCKLCGLSLSTRGHRFMRLLENLIDAGESRYTLADLVAIVSK